MKKWMRNYKIIFEIGYRTNLIEYIPQEKLEISYPFTLKLNIQSGINNGDVSKGTFQLINLSPQDQARLWKDEFNQTKYITMWLYAGYGDNMPLIFKGDIMKCYSYRGEGSTDFITEIQSSDSTYLYQYGVANYTFAKGTKTENLLQTLLNEVPLYKLGYITSEIPPLKKDRTFIGQTLDLLGRQYGAYQLYFDKGELNILGEQDVVPGDILVITAESGLLGSPIRTNQTLQCNMIFEPQIKLGQAVELLCDSIPFVNQIYKVISISHQGVISPVENGTLKTVVSLYLGTAPFNELKKATTTYTGKPTHGQWDKPVQGRVSSPFGYRNKPNAKASTNHKGMDIAAPLNTTVYAPANGKVIASYISGSLTSGFGRLIKIDHGKIDGKQVQSWYGHLNKWLVGSGDVVSKGQPIGLVGNTGNSTGPHLHFEILENSVAVNPIKYIGAYG